MICIIRSVSGEVGGDGTFCASKEKLQETNTNKNISDLEVKVDFNTIDLGSNFFIYLQRESQIYLVMNYERVDSYEL
jgi:hypothetical protein